VYPVQSSKREHDASVVAAVDSAPMPTQRVSNDPPGIQRREYAAAT
jgi:hypothetical protein